MVLLNFFDRIVKDYSDIIAAFSIPMVIAILAFALPLLLQTAARVDDKYDSTLLIKVFRRDLICKWFLISLLASLISCLFWILQLPRCVDWGDLINIVIDNSSLILLVLSTIVLVVFSVLSVWLTYVYYLPEKLLARLEKQYNTAKNEQDKQTFFYAISSILLFSIKKEGEPLARELQEFYAHEFINYRSNRSNTVIEYPDYFYDVMFDANECLCQRERKSISWYNGSFCDYFIDEYQQTTISEKTYTFIWKCIRQSLFYEKDEFVFSYWRKAYQYFSLWLNSIYPEYDKDFKIINQQTIDKREEERYRFLEFHYALGGLLMKEKKYNLLQQLMMWTNQTPPKYVLLPETMSEVITMFMSISSPDKDFLPVYFEQRYPFPDTHGVYAEDIIKMWIKRYLAILFLRQYKLNKYYIYSNPLEMPKPPLKLAEKRRWNDELDILKRYVQDYLNDNNEPLRIIGLEDLISEEWYSKNNKTAPIDLINGFKHEIEEDTERTKQNQPIDLEKKNALFKCIKETVLNAYDETSAFLRRGKSSAKMKLRFIGKHGVLDKAAFAADSEVSYVNEDTIIPDTLAQEFKVNMMNIFLLMDRTQYSIKEIKLFEAVKHLSLTEGEFVILNIGLNLEYYRDYIKVDGLHQDAEKWYYNKIEIIEAPFNPNLSHSIIIIRKEDLPFITYQELDKTIIEKYSLEELDNDKKIYASIIDLNTSSLAEEIQKETNIDEVKEKVLVCVDINVGIGCNETARCLHLKVFSQFDDKGTPNTIDQIKKLWDTSSNK